MENEVEATAVRNSNDGVLLFLDKSGFCGPAWVFLNHLSTAALAATVLDMLGEIK